MARTKRVGITGRFGARYGLTVKQKVLAIEKKQKAKYECPKCTKKTIKRSAKGIWICKKCNHTFAGGTFYLGEA